MTGVYAAEIVLFVLGLVLQTRGSTSRALGRGLMAGSLFCMVILYLGVS